MKKKQFELDFDFSKATEPEAKAEIRRRILLGKLSPQGAEVLLRSYREDFKNELLAGNYDLKKIEVYNKIGQQERAVAELDKKDTKFIGGKC